jgi:uncharacterized protein YbjT (DUF2867 family)
VTSRAFVAGATGYTGREVVRQLVERGVETIAHVRPSSSRLDEWRDRFGKLGAMVDSTAWSEQAMGATLTRIAPTHVFALLGTTKARGRAAARAGARPESYESVDYALTSTLIRAAVRAGSEPRFVYLSAIGVRAGVTSAYLQARWRIESELRASGLTYTIARPGFITGPDRDERRPLERASATVVDGVLAVVGAFGGTRLRQRYRSTTSSTLAQALVRLAFDPAAANAVVESDGLRG